jgi:hypothetical protein
MDYSKLKQLVAERHPPAQFEDSLMYEVELCNSFLAQRAGKISRQLSYLKQLHEGNAEKEALTNKRIHTDYHSEKAMAARKSRKRALVELYRQYLRLETFKDLNYTACVKMLHKYDKTSGFAPISSRILLSFEKLPFYSTSLLGDLQEQIELFFASEYCGSNRIIAKTQLMLKKNVATNWQLFRVGEHTGVAVVLLFWCMWDAIVDDSHRHNLWDDPVMSVYTFCGCILLLLWCWGINVYVWNKAGINYIYMFEFRPQDCLS